MSVRVAAPPGQKPQRCAICVHRQAFNGQCKPLLCSWHATKCWLEQLRNKLVDKSRFREAFDCLYAVMYLRARTTDTDAQCLAAIDDQLAAFRTAFVMEQGVHDWSDREWDPKTGAFGAPFLLTRPERMLSGGPDRWRSH